MELTISIRKVTRFLLFVVLGFALGSLAEQLSRHLFSDPYFFGLGGQLNLENEKNIPAYYSGLTLLLCSGLLAFIAVYQQKNKGRYVWQWKGLSFLFFCLALDEVFSFHEKTTAPLKNSLSSSGFNFATQGIFAFTWVVLGICFVLLMLLLYSKFLLALPTQFRRLFCLAGALFVTGSLGGEMIGSYWADLNGKENFVYTAIASLEELFEMLGVVVFIYALLSYISSELTEVRVRFNSSDQVAGEPKAYPSRNSETELS